MCQTTPCPGQFYVKGGEGLVCESKFSYKGIRFTVLYIGPTLMAEWSYALPLTPHGLSLLHGYTSQLGHAP